MFRGVHETDFLLFDQFRDTGGLVLDVGANRGHSAIAVLRRTKKLRVLSLEPNPAMKPALIMIRCLHPFRFRFLSMAAGSARAAANLTIPLADTDLSSQASLDRSEFTREFVQQRLAGDGHSGNPADFQQIPVSVKPVDDLALKPDVVKIDVEGWEAQALEGMHKTLKQHKPMLIIEMNHRSRWMPALAAMGYRFHTFEEDGLAYHPDWKTIPGLNVICLHPGSESAISRQLQEQFRQ